MAERLGQSKIALIARVRFAHSDRLKGGVQENTLTAYRFGQMPSNDLGEEEEVTFYNLDLHHALLSRGWMVSTGRVGGTFSNAKEVWFLEPQPENEPPDMLPMDRTRVWRLDGASVEAVERKARERVIQDMFEHDLDKNSLALQKQA